MSRLFDHSGPMHDPCLTTISLRGYIFKARCYEVYGMGWLWSFTATWMANMYLVCSDGCNRVLCNGGCDHCDPGVQVPSPKTKSNILVSVGSQQPYHHIATKLASPSFGQKSPFSMAITPLTQPDRLDRCLSSTRTQSDSESCAQMSMVNTNAYNEKTS